ncbi:MAG TPA: 3-oxoacyl-[acyl-carrier-protein] reductase [Candidatus Omnitrophota bacterium]|nr:3-oxoacyl-[acyl-carrier-protein] reductase [Candidatus Omnitrophota bacterium]
MILKGKVAIITGATRGIGRAIALELAKEGADISFNYLKNAEQAKNLVKEINSLGRKAFAEQVDISDFAKVKDFVEKTKNTFGKLDILVNNAGIIIDKALMMMEEQDWRKVIDTDLNGAFNATRACIVSFLKQKSGQIVNISSVSGIIGSSRQTNYSASKAGIIGFTKALAKEVAEYNIRVNAVAPGYIQTDMLNSLKEEQKESVKKFIPLGRFGKPEDIARVVLFLLSDASQYITGQVIAVDGGIAMR